MRVVVGPPEIAALHDAPQAIRKIRSVFGSCPIGVAMTIDRIDSDFELDVVHLKIRAQSGESGV
jgi:hypothetical protein